MIIQSLKRMSILGVISLSSLTTSPTYSIPQLIEETKETVVEKYSIENEEKEEIIEQVKIEEVRTSLTKDIIESIEEPKEEKQTPPPPQAPPIVKPKYKEVKSELTFYTDLAICNGSENVGKNAIGGYLSETSIAIPRKSMPFGTKIEIEGYGTRIADDVGNPKYIKIKEDGTYIFDVFMPRLKGETDKQYKQRIMNMGRVQTTAKIYN